MFSRRKSICWAGQQHNYEQQSGTPCSPLIFKVSMQPYIFYKKKSEYLVQHCHAEFYFFLIVPFKSPRRKTCRDGSKGHVAHGPKLDLHSVIQRPSPTWNSKHRVLKVHRQCKGRTVMHPRAALLPKGWKTAVIKLRNASLHVTIQTEVGERSEPPKKAVSPAETVLQSLCYFTSHL